MKKSFLRIVSCMLSLVMAFACVGVTALAAPFVPETQAVAIADHPDDTMNPTKTVYPIGNHAFYVINADGSVSYAAREEAPEYEAVPAAYIFGSEYNTTGLEYGIYLTTGNEVHFVPMNECHLEADGSYTWYHGTKDGATVSEDVDTATNVDPDMATQFFIYIEDGIDPDGPEVPHTLPGLATGDPRVEYDIEVTTQMKYQLKATVPMYVCMYGYRGTGTVVTPSSSAYTLKNYSTIDAANKATITDITKVTHMTKIYDEDHSDDELYAIAFDTATGIYTYWYSDPTVDSSFTTPANYQVIVDQHINASGECFVIFIDGAYTFKAAGALDGSDLRETVTAVDSAHQLASDFIPDLDGDGSPDRWNFTKTPAVGDVKDASADGDTTQVKGLALRVSELQAEPATWRLVAQDTAALKRGELVMTLAPSSAYVNASAIDLSTCSAKTDINDRGWILEAPTNITAGAVADGDETDLPMIVSARMAGGNVNAAGCTPVVKVSYTLIPLFEIGDAQTNTVTAIASNK